MLLKRTIIAATLIGALITASQSYASADVTVIEGSEISPPEASPVGQQGTIYKLEVTPAKEASPAFKHRFTVPPHETIAGNAITHYLRSLGERGLTRPWEYAEEETDRKVYDWLGLETKSVDIPLDKLKLCSEVFDGYVNNHMKRATLCREAEWGLGIEDLRGTETISFLLPSVQNTRSMARAMMLQNRLAVIEKRYDDSVERLRMTYQLGRNVNEMGILVSSLVGIAEVNMANKGTMLLIGAEDSPNLYWALAELPTPIIDPRRALQLDTSMGKRLFPEIMDIENTNFSDEEWKRLLNKYAGEISSFSEMMSGLPNHSDPISPDTITFLGSMASYSNAKRRLVTKGFAKEKVSKMCVAQVILTDTAMDIEYFSQLCEKSWHVPYPKSHGLNKAFEDEIQAEERKMRLGAIVAGMITPAILNVRIASVRCQAQVNLLMAIESLRHHAALHRKFPQSLEELDLPVRDNPISGEPFNYSLEAGKVVLTYEDQVYQEIYRYEISIKK